MSDVNLSEFKALYLTTADEYLRKMESSLAQLSSNPANTDAIEEMHISSHSLKSQSLVMGYQTTGELSHVLELIFRKFHDEQSALPPEIFLHLQNAITELRSSLSTIQKEGKEKDLSETISSLKGVAGV